MAAKARIEWIRLGYGQGTDLNGVHHNVIKSIHGVAVLDVSTTATVAGSRPVAPDFGGAKSGYALVRCLGSSDNPIVVAWGSDPSAAETNGKYLEPGEEIPIFVTEGQRLSFIEVV